MSHPPPLPPRARATAEPALSSPTWSTPTDTGLVTLPPGFIEALRRVVPRRRRAKLPYIVGAGLLAVVGVLAADASTRELLAARWRHEAPGAARERTTPATAGSLDVKPAVPVDRVPTAAAIPVPMVDHAATAAPAPTSSVAPAAPKTARPRKGAPRTAGKT